MHAFRFTCKHIELQGAYKFGKMKFPEFSKISRPSNQSFPDNHKVKIQGNKSL